MRKGVLVCLHSRSWFWTNTYVSYHYIFIPRTFLGAYFSSLIWYPNTYTCSHAGSLWISHLSNQVILVQSSHVLFWCFNAYLRHFLARFFIKRVHLTVRHFHIKSSWSQRRIVIVDAEILTIYFSKVNGTCLCSGDDVFLLGICCYSWASVLKKIVWYFACFKTY